MKLLPPGRPAAPPPQHPSRAGGSALHQMDVQNATEKVRERARVHMVHERGLMPPARTSRLSDTMLCPSLMPSQGQRCRGALWHRKHQTAAAGDGSWSRSCSRGS